MKRHCKDPKCVAGPNGFRHVYSYGNAGQAGLGQGLQVIKPKTFAHVAHSLPPNDPAFPRVNEYGEGVFHTKKEIEEYQAKRPGSVWK